MIAEVCCQQAMYLGNLLWDKQDFLWKITLLKSLSSLVENKENVSPWGLPFCCCLWMLEIVGEQPCGQSWMTAQWFHSLQWIADTAGLCEPRFIPDICLYNPQAASVLFLQTSSHLCSVPAGHPPLPARLKVSLSLQSFWYGQGRFAWLFFLLLPFLALCWREALPLVSAARGSPAAWHDAERSLGSWTALISSGRVTLAAKWRQNCWSFCTAPSAPAPATAQLLPRLLSTLTWQITCCAATDGWGTADFPCLTVAKFSSFPALPASFLAQSFCGIEFFLTLFRNFSATLAHLLVYSPLSSGRLMSSVYTQRVLKNTRALL